MTTGRADLPNATRVAADRTRLAYERTLMAWIRTATSLISFGFTIYKFFQYLRESNPASHPGAFGPRSFALLMMGIGLAALTLAVLDHRQSLQSLRDTYGVASARSLATCRRFLRRLAGCSRAGDSLVATLTTWKRH